MRYIYLAAAFILSLLGIYKIIKLFLDLKKMNTIVKKTFVVSYTKKVTMIYNKYFEKQFDNIPKEFMYSVEMRYKTSELIRKTARNTLVKGFMIIIEGDYKQIFFKHYKLKEKIDVTGNLKEDVKKTMQNIQWKEV